MSNDIGRLRLMQALDSLFPIGAFTLSNGMETYTAKGLVKDGKTLSAFLNAYLYTFSYSDGGFAAKAAAGEDLRLLDELCTASKPPYELRNGSSKLCARFIKTVNALGGSFPSLKEYSEMKSCEGHHCIAVGLLIKELEMDIGEGLGMYFYSQLSSLVNHAAKLVPLSQIVGQQCLAEAVNAIPQAVKRAESADISELGISGGGFELRSMQHERLYSRLYIS